MIMGTTCTKGVVWLLTLGAVFIAAPSHAQTAATHTSSTSNKPHTIGENLSELVEQAIAAHPSLDVARAQVSAARQQRSQQTTLPDPVISVAHAIKSVETRVGPQEQRIGVSQRIPWPGKLRTKGQYADALVKVASAEQKLAVDKLIWQVERAALRYYRWSHVHHLMEESLALLSMLIAQQESRVKHGTQDTAALLRYQERVAKLESDLARSTATGKGLAAELNGFLARDPESPLVTLAEVPGVTQTTLTTYLARIDHAPTLAQNHATILAAESAINVSDAAFYPDFGVGVDYIRTGEARMGSPADSGKDPLLVKASIEIPLWSIRKKRAQRDAAKAKTRAAYASLEAKSLQWREQVSKAYATLQEATENHRIMHETLLPKSTARVALARRAYAVNKLPIESFIEAQLQALSHEHHAIHAQVDAALAQSDLHFLTGMRSAMPVAGETNHE